MEIYERIKHLRKKILKLTQKDFAKELGVSRSNIGNIEVGRINITDRVMDDICYKYSINKDWLLYGNGEIFIKSKKTILDELTSAHGLNDRERAIIQSFLELSPEGRAGVLEYVDNLVKLTTVNPKRVQHDEIISKRIEYTDKMIEQSENMKIQT